VLGAQDLAGWTLNSHDPHKRNVGSTVICAWWVLVIVLALLPRMSGHGADRDLRSRCLLRHACGGGQRSTFVHGRRRARDRGCALGRGQLCTRTCPPCRQTDAPGLVGHKGDLEPRVANGLRLLYTFGHVATYGCSRCFCFPLSISPWPLRASCWFGLDGPRRDPAGCEAGACSHPPQSARPSV
jgi:hypothetical protein